MLLPLVLPASGGNSLKNNILFCMGFNLFVCLILGQAPLNPHNE